MKAPKSQSGVALVITLIMLTVITFMAVTFLILSRREGAQVATLTAQSNAKFAADAALEAAKAQIIAQMLANANGLAGTLQVSTNFINTNYNNGAGAALTNVSYNGPFPGGNDYAQMLNNLLILPRPPVFIVTNKNFPTNLDFRYYLDLNRNGRYDTNGYTVDYDTNNLPIPDPANPANPLMSAKVGDPEWVGILNRPDYRHSSTNTFIARYAFFAAPIGNSLDINFIHNQAKLLPSVTDNGFIRDQGVGTWEINLAGFLHDLNTNWDTQSSGIQYNYQTNLSGSFGTSFNDATSIIQYRYNNNYANLSSANFLFGTRATNFLNDKIDDYSRGIFGTNYTYPFDPDYIALLNSPWSGADNLSKYFSPQDLFNSVPLPSSGTSFSNRLYSAGTNFDSYNRYTFYRMLAQMSFDSAPEPSPYPGTSKLNLNYCNLNGYVATNFQPWQPVQFFTNAADRMIRATIPPLVTTNFVGAGQYVVTNYLSITNIPIYPVNLYTPAVHRLLQLAANIYDASTNRAINTNAIDYPSVFRPIFRGAIVNGALSISICGYAEVTNNIDFSKPLDLRNGTNLFVFSSLGLFTNNVYGIPYVIGAKKDIPAFYRFIFAPVIREQRKLELTKNAIGDPPNKWSTNIQYAFAISNYMAVDAWYPATNALLNRSIALIVTNEITVYLTNSSNTSPIVIYSNSIGYTNIALNGTWRGSPNLYGYGKIAVNTNSFKTPLYVSFPILSNAVIHYNNGTPEYTDTNFTTTFPFEKTSPGYYTPNWGLAMTNRLRMMLVDVTDPTPRLLDYVQLAGIGQSPGLDTTIDITSDLYKTYPDLWDTNLSGGIPKGIVQQLAVSQRYAQGGSLPSVSPPWNHVPGITIDNINAAISNFISFTSQGSTNLAAQAPYAPITTFYLSYSWSANDPLVHYLVNDVTDLTQTNNPQDVSTLLNANPLDGKYRVLSTLRYQPWGYTQNGGYLIDVRTNEMAYKDYGVDGVDGFGFPTNKYPNIGWLGRVHRGTPWQSVYLKSTGLSNATWVNWTGDYLTNYVLSGNTIVAQNDAALSQPYMDWQLMDLFTTAANDNASRGQLSVNQTNLAAWSAVLDGVSVLVNSSSNNYSTLIIDPVSNATQIATILKGINSYRTNYPGGIATNYAERQAFSSMGQILGVPQLSVASPFLNSTNTVGLSDAMYESIPQQILSLLRLGSPRYVIFSYGQALKPAERSVIQSGPFFGMVTNYQIMSEVVTRTVLRIENFPTPGQNPLPAPKVIIESYNVLPPE